MLRPSLRVCCRIGATKGIGRAAASAKTGYAALESGIAFCMDTGKGKILVVSHDPSLADVRKNILETAGYLVIEASNDGAVEQACRRDGINLIMLGYSLAPSEKRRIWAASSRYCDVPILELHHGGTPELVERNVFAHESQKADDFLHAVENLLAKTRTCKNAK